MIETEFEMIKRHYEELALWATSFQAEDWLIPILERHKDEIAELKQRRKDDKRREVEDRGGSWFYATEN